ncbi:MAG: GNAT family N-acetyltransferase [Candidatus Dormibacteria bacterium]
MLNDPTFTVREATVDDAASLAAVYQESAVHHVRLDPSVYTMPESDRLELRYRERFGARPRDPDEWAILVAEFRGTVVGYIELRRRRPDGEPRMVRDQVSVETDIAVLDEYRGRGVGSQLVAAGEAWAVDHGADLILLDVHVANTDAIRFYQDRHGYRTSGMVLMKRPDRGSAV